MTRFEVLTRIALAVPHASTEDDVYNGFSFRKVSFSHCVSPRGLPFSTLDRCYRDSQFMVRHRLNSLNVLLSNIVSGQSFIIQFCTQIPRNSNQSVSSMKTEPSETIQRSLWRSGLERGSAPGVISWTQPFSLLPRLCYRYSM